MDVVGNWNPNDNCTNKVVVNSLPTSRFDDSPKLPNPLQLQLPGIPPVQRIPRWWTEAGSKERAT